MVLIQTSVGLPSAAQATGATPYQRSDPAGALVNTNGHLRLVEPCRNAGLFTASTVNTGVTVASLTLTTTAPTALYNPTGSGVNLYLQSLTMGYVSGTLGAGQFFLVSHANGAAVTGTAATYINSLLIGNSTVAKGLPTYTSTVPASGKVIQNLWVSDAYVGSTTYPPPLFTFDFDGRVGVAPGSSISLQGITAAGASPLAVFTWVWEEVTN